MKSLNRVTLIGNLGQDPEIKYLDNGTAVGRFSLATSESYKDKDGNWQDRPTEWHNIVVWRYLAENAEKQLKKGMTVYVEGQIQYRSYTDKDGVEKKSTDIVCKAFKAFGKTEKSSVGNDFPTEEQDPFAGKANKSTEKKSKPTKDADSNTNEMGDDLPF